MAPGVGGEAGLASFCLLCMNCTLHPAEKTTHMHIEEGQNKIKTAACKMFHQSHSSLIITLDHPNLPVLCVGKSVVTERTNNSNEDNVIVLKQFFTHNSFKVSLNVLLKLL